MRIHHKISHTAEKPVIAPSSLCGPCSRRSLRNNRADPPSFFNFGRIVHLRTICFSRASYETVTVSPRLARNRGNKRGVTLHYVDLPFPQGLVPSSGIQQELYPATRAREERLMGQLMEATQNLISTIHLLSSAASLSTFPRYCLLQP
jgi:hypothetical protein